MSVTLTKKPDDRLKRQARGEDEGVGGWLRSASWMNLSHPTPEKKKKKEVTAGKLHTCKTKRCPRSPRWGSRRRKKYQERRKTAQMPSFQAAHLLCYLHLSGSPSTGQRSPTTKKGLHNPSIHRPRYLVAFTPYVLIYGLTRWHSW